jgi:hypothetical protein
VVLMKDEVISLSENERKLLTRGPKFCVIRDCKEEEYLCDIEMSTVEMCASVDLCNPEVEPASVKPMCEDQAEQY